MIGPRLVLLSALMATAPALGATQATAQPGSCPQHLDLRDLMSVNQFYKAGLRKLSGQQLSHLNRWLEHYVRAVCHRQATATNGANLHAAEAGTSGAAKARHAAGKASRITSRIVGEFHGWTGDTLFRLQNGEVWKQAGPGYFETNLNNPKVIIKKLLIGYVLKVHGYGKEVFVRRIR